MKHITGEKGNNNEIKQLTYEITIESYKFTNIDKKGKIKCL